MCEAESTSKSGGPQYTIRTASMYSRNDYQPIGNVGGISYQSKVSYG